MCSGRLGHAARGGAAISAVNRGGFAAVGGGCHASSDGLLFDVADVVAFGHEALVIVHKEGGVGRLVGVEVADEAWVVEENFARLVGHWVFSQQHREVVAANGKVDQVESSL